MYKLVIADDEADIRNGLANLVKWPELGFEVVGVFEDGRDVIDYLKEHEVDVILTDIVMTYQSGLDIARWVYENRQNVIVVILSGYSEFKYAQQAIHYGVKEYLLKPTNLRDLEYTFGKIRTLLDKTQNQFQNIAEFHLHFQRTLFYLMLNGIINDEIAKELLHYSKFPQLIENCFWSVIVIRNQYYLNEQDLEDCIKLFNQELNQKNHCRNVIIKYLNMIIILVLSLAGSGIDDYKKNLEKMICEILLRLNCLFGYQLHLELMLVNCDYYSLFLDTRLKEVLNSADGNKVDKNMDYEKQYWELVHEALRAFERWDIEYIKKAVQYLTCEAKDDFLRRLGFSIIMKIRSYYQKQNLLPQMISDDEIYYKIFLQKGIEDVKTYILTVIETFEKDVREANANVVDAICNYVRNHMDEKLTLNDIAAKVYLNPNYLSRLFKEKTGENYSDYIMKIRVEYAKELLKDFRLKVYEVGERVGYRDIRHFYKVFYKVVGMTPSEYRKHFFNMVNGKEKK